MYEINSKIWANLVRPGMIVCTADGRQIEVEKVIEGYDTMTFDNMVWTATIGYTDQVQVLGYFNPEDRNAYTINR